MLACGVIPPPCLFTVEILDKELGGNKLNDKGGELYSPLGGTGGGREGGQSGD